ARTHYAETRFEAATCGLEIQTGNRRTSHPRGRDGGVREKLAARVNRAGASERVRAVHHAWQPGRSFCGSSVFRPPGGVLGLLGRASRSPPSSRLVLPCAPQVGEAWQFSDKLLLAATTIYL